MNRKKKSEDPSEVPAPDTHPEINPATKPEEPVMPGENPEIIPEEKPVDPSPVEIPATDQI